MIQPKIPYQHRESGSDSLRGAGDQMNSCGVPYWSSVWEYTWTTAIVPLLPGENYHLSFLDDEVSIKSKFGGKDLFAGQWIRRKQWCVSRYVWVWHHKLRSWHFKYVAWVYIFIIFSCIYCIELIFAFILACY